ncbi:MAG: NADH-quinone oxidoreductase subunit NuoN [Sphingomonadales bacterium]|jgi:NADH-quinone oxidoreductase subunit N
MSGVLANWTLALPELVMAVGAMALLMLGVFAKNEATQRLNVLAIILMAGALILVTQSGNGTAFNGLFIGDAFARVMKLLILIGSIGAVIMARPYLKNEQMERFEYPVLIVLATLGMMMMVSAGNLISLYMGLELQSLSLYVLAAINRDSRRSTEAGLKYFVLGALSSGMLLYGSSLIYGFAGTTSFDLLAQTLPTALEGGPSIGLILGLVFLLAGLAFKISAVPFHMWTPDVYEGAPTSVTAFFAGAPKIAAMGLFMRVIFDPLPALVDQWQQIIMVIAVLSMIVGAVAAIAQSNIKRLMAYSSIGHVGYALVGLSAGTQEGVQSVVVYMAIYLVMTLGTFACILAMRRSETMVEDISDLSGLARTQPSLAVVLSIFMVSLLGFPPFAGFFAKVAVFTAAVNAGLYVLAVLGVLASVIGAYYYLRIVKVMFFDEPAAPFEKQDDLSSRLLLFGTAIVASPLGFVFAGPVINWSKAAAAALAG